MKTLIAALLLVLALMFCAGTHTAIAGTGDKIYVALDRDAGVAVVDPVSLDAWGNIKSGNTGINLKVSPDKKFVYVSLYGDGMVKCIDVSTDAVVREVKTVSGPLCMDMTPDGKRLLAGGEGGLSVIDTESFKVLKSLDLGANPQAVRIAPDGGTAYLVVGDPEAALVALDMKDMKPVQRLDLPNQVYDLEMSPDGKKLYASSTTARKVVVVDTAKMKVVGEIDAYGDFGLALSRDGSELWFPGPEGNLTAYSLKENKVVAQMSFAGACGSRKVAFSPDGKRAFAWPAGNDCRVVNVYDTALKKKVGEIRVPDFPRGLVYIER